MSVLIVRRVQLKPHLLLSELQARVGVWLSLGEFQAGTLGKLGEKNSQVCVGDFNKLRVFLGCRRVT